jgi:hypothetical protein
MPNTRTRANKSASFTTLLKDNPIITVGGLVVAACATVAGVMDWQARGELSVLEQQHKAELANQDSKFHEDVAKLAVEAKNELISTTEPLKQTIEDLSQKISSIERKMSDSGPKYLDVSNLTVGPETIKALGPKYHYYPDDNFYESAPEMDGWMYSESNEFQFDSSFFGKADEAPSGDLGRLLAESKMHIWRFKDGIHFKVAGQHETGAEDLDLHFYPEVVVERWNMDALKKRLEMAANLMSPIFDSLSKSQDDTAARGELKEVLDATKSKPDSVKASLGSVDVDETGDIRRNSDAVQTLKDEGKKLADQVVASTKFKMDVVQELDKAVNYDMANFFLASKLMEAAFVFPNLMSAQVKVISAQKKGNVFYLQEQITFPKAHIYENGVPASREQPVIIDREVFFFGSGSDGDLIDIYLPREVERDAFVYTQSWLLGFRVPVE